MTDDAGMNTDTTSIESTESRTAPPPRRLVRPVAGRSVAGVAAGLSEYLNMPVGLIRFGFLFALIFGGLGLVLYVAGWLLIRDEAESESIAQRVFENLGVGPSWVGIALLIVAGVIVLDNLTFMPGSLIWAVVLVTVGLLLYRGDIGPRPEAAQETGTAQGAATPTKGLPPVGGGEEPPPPPAGPRPGTPSSTIPPTPPPPPSILGRLTIGMGFLALGILAIVDNATTLIDPQPRHYLALATVVLGLALLTGSFIGRARWTILLGVFLVPALLASPLAEVEWDGQLRHVVAPAELSSLEGSYRDGAGSYLFDLTESDWDGQTVSLDVDLAAGEIVIALPDDVGLTGSAQVGIGVIEAPDGDRVGLGSADRTFDLTGEHGTLDVELDVGAGAIEVHTGDDPEIRGETWNMRLGPGHVAVTERNR